MSRFVLCAALVALWGCDNGRTTKLPTDTTPPGVSQRPPLISPPVTVNPGGSHHTLRPPPKYVAIFQTPQLTLIPPEKPTAHTYELRLLGVKTDGYSKAFVGVRDVAIVSGDQRLPLELSAQRSFDLAQKDQAWLIARFTPPRDLDQVEVYLQLDDGGGFETLLENGELDMRTAPLQFTAKVPLLKLEGHAVVQIDLARSFVADAPGRKLFVPSFTVNY